MYVRYSLSGSILIKTQKKRNRLLLKSIKQNEIIQQRNFLFGKWEKRKFCRFFHIGFNMHINRNLHSNAWYASHLTVAMLQHDYFEFLWQSNLLFSFISCYYCTALSKQDLYFQSYPKLWWYDIKWICSFSFSLSFKHHVVDFHLIR